MGRARELADEMMISIQEAKKIVARQDLEEMIEESAIDENIKPILLKMLKHVAIYD